LFIFGLKLNKAIGCAVAYQIQSEKPQQTGFPLYFGAEKMLTKPKSASAVPPGVTNNARFQVVF
jgi:hypothetical protein